MFFLSFDSDHCLLLCQLITIQPIDIAIYVNTKNRFYPNFSIEYSLLILITFAALNPKPSTINPLALELDFLLMNIQLYVETISFLFAS